jgi:DNA-binding MarR family transcriptional regulator
VQVRDDELRSFHSAFTELVRKYQFRDRCETACHGLSVSQCHALEELAEAGSLRMGELASRLHLSVSAVTRVADQLVAKELVVRMADPDDRRANRLKPSPAGVALFERIRSELLRWQREVLEEHPPQVRKALVECLEQLAQAVDRWRSPVVKESLGREQVR